MAAFTVSRPLPLGMSYPFDWAFITGTRAADGDPVDAMVLNDVPTYPGVIIQCRPVGMVELLQADSGGKSEINNRVVLLPKWREAHIEEASDLPDQVRSQIESFFVNADLFTDKKAKVTGWASSKKATRFIDAHLTKG
jgi:inorganic pyrophosphatase